MNLWAQPCAQQPRRCAGGEERKRRNGTYSLSPSAQRGVCHCAGLYGSVPGSGCRAEETTGTPQTLTASEVKEMQQTDVAVTALTDSAAYAGMSEEERQAAALAQLDALAAQAYKKRTASMWMRKTAW